MSALQGASPTTSTAESLKILSAVSPKQQVANSRSHAESKVGNVASENLPKEECSTKKKERKSLGKTEQESAYAAHIAEKDKEIQELKKKLSQIEKCFESGIKFLKKTDSNPGSDAAQSAVSPDKALKAEVQLEADSFSSRLNADLVRKNQERTQLMKEVDGILASIGALRSVSESLKANVFELKVTKKIKSSEGVESIEKCLEDFQKQLKEHEGGFVTLSNSIMFEVPHIHRVLESLNQLEVIASKENLHLRNEFEEKWNKACRETYVLKWNIDFMTQAIAVLPQIKTLDGDLQDTGGRAQSTKKFYQAVSLDNESKSSLKTEFENFQQEFKQLNERHASLHLKLGELLKSLHPQSLQDEYMKSFAAHNQAVQQKNREDVSKIINTFNAEKAQLAKHCVIEWKKTCERIKDLGLQIDQMGYGLDQGAIPLKSAIGSSMPYYKRDAGKYAKVSTEYNPQLESYIK